MIFKRLFDLTFTLLGLLVLSPLLVMLFILVWIKLGSPVLFCQQRPGLYGRPFNLYKFRTMSDERDSEGDLLPDEQRLTGFGILMRKTSLDELPELINVIKGDMSLVGPRPLLMEYLGQYTSEQKRRHEVRPGITGLAQVSGRQNIKFSKRIEYDVWYVDHQNLFLDLKILSLTFCRVIRMQGFKPFQDVQDVDDLGLSINNSLKKVGKNRKSYEN